MSARREWVKTGVCPITGNPIFTRIPRDKIKDEKRKRYTSNEALALSAGRVPETSPVTVGGVKFPSTAGGIAVPRDISMYAVADLKRVANDLIRRATPQEAKALHQLFVVYAEKAAEKAA